jgi:hypothetical protein
MLDWSSWIKDSLSIPLSLLPSPPNFEQPILPGWVFGSITNITEHNSSAPDTERAIVAAQSYGRQLGRIMDALAVLISDLPEPQRHATAFKEFAKIRKEINNIKARAAFGRLDRIADDLAALKEAKPAEYERVAGHIRAALNGG